MHSSQTHMVDLLVQVDNMEALVVQQKKKLVAVTKDMVLIIKKTKIFTQGMVVNLVN